MEHYNMIPSWEQVFFLSGFLGGNSSGAVQSPTPSFILNTCLPSSRKAGLRAGRGVTENGVVYGESRRYRFFIRPLALGQKFSWHGKNQPSFTTSRQR